MFIEIYKVYFVNVIHLVYVLSHIFGSWVTQTYTIVNTTYINTRAGTTTYPVITIIYIHMYDK